MTTKTNKQYKVIVSLLGVLIIIGLGLLIFAGIDYHKIKEKERLEAEQRKDAIKDMKEDVKYEYERLKSMAFLWNEVYAKLTLNHTRDTVKHKEYTTEDFVDMHRSLSFVVRRLQSDDQNIDRFHPNQAMALFPTGFQLQHLLGTSRKKALFFKDFDELNRQYDRILDKTTKTEVVDYSARDARSPYRPYFEILHKMDRNYYELLAYRYPIDLDFLVHTYPDFVETAKRRLFGDHISEVTQAFFQAKNDSLPPEKPIQIIPRTVPSDTLLTVYGVYTNTDKTLVMVHTEEEIYPMTDAQRLVFLDGLNALVPKKASENMRYYHVSSEDGYYYASDVNKLLYPHVLENDDEEILRFYDDDYKRYYVTGSYDPFTTFYPGQQEPAAAND